MCRSRDLIGQRCRVGLAVGLQAYRPSIVVQRLVPIAGQAQARPGIEYRPRTFSIGFRRRGHSPPKTFVSRRRLRLAFRPDRPDIRSRVERAPNLLVVGTVRPPVDAVDFRRALGEAAAAYAP